MGTEKSLTRLKIASGGRGSTEILTHGWSVSLHEQSQKEPDDAFALLTLRHPNGRSRTIGLAREDLTTKGKSPWRRNNLYRLTPAAVIAWAAEIDKAIAKYTDQK